MNTFTRWYNAITSTVMDAGSRIIGAVANPIQSAQGGIMGTIKGWFSQATTAASDLVTNAKQSLMKTIVTKAMETAVSEVENQVKLGVASAGEQLGKGLTDALESAVSGSSDALDTTLGSIGKKFREVLGTFKEKIDTKAEEDGISNTEQLGINLAKILHDKLSDLGDSCFQAKKISLDAFKQSSTDAINRAKPGIEKELGAAFVNFLLSPVISFLKSLVSSLLTSVAGFFSGNSKPSPVANQVSPDTTDLKAEEPKEEAEVEVDSGMRQSMQ